MAEADAIKHDALQRDFQGLLLKLNVRVLDG
jgi:hypothetical protein